MPIKLANNASTRLASPITAASTSITVESGGGDKFPVTDDDVYFPMTIVAADGSLEIVKCTARSSDTFTIERAQEGTTAKDFAAGSAVELRLTAGAMEDVIQEAEDRFQQIADSLEGFGVGDYLTTKRDPGANWLRRDGSIYDKADYPALGAYFETLPAGVVWTDAPTSGLTLTVGASTFLYRLSTGDLLISQGNALQISRDDESWETAKTFSLPYSDSRCAAVAADGKILVVFTCGQTGTTSSISAQISTDNGSSFSTVTISDMQSCSDLVHFNGYFIAIDAKNGYVYYSSNGTSWTKGPKIGLGSGNSWVNPYKFFQLGSTLYAMPASNDYWGTTTNGTSWTGNLDYGGYAFSRHTSVNVVGGKAFTIRSAQSTQISSTTNPSSGWSVQSPGTTNGLQDIAVNGAFMLAVGLNGDASLSANDGASWAKTGVGYSGSFYRIVPHTDARKFLAISQDGLKLGEIPETDMFAVPNDDPDTGWIKAL